ncbi:hypothetical protein [Micromonospora tarensis]|uniref:tRNA nuclease CdiA C-terminal domain-containing protein n=1 Tax=Micromonospora tarensis TaxID=2806100 RepID=A0ABS1YI25_9ACTN|nr:hypothetical protein [Micromonospora tarensis]MBM0277075.1 hypothetical protein [Micromonospora tarensis]
MAKPKTPPGGHGDSETPSRPGDGDGDIPGQRRRSSSEVPDTVTGGQDFASGELKLGRPGGDSGDSPGRPAGGDDGYQTPRPGTPEYERRLEELAADPAHNGNISAKSRIEAEVGLAAEAEGKIPGPIRRAELDNSDPAFQKDQGEFFDANGENWDVKSPNDLFPAGRRAGEPMPEGMKGRYDGEEFEQKLADEVDGGQNVILNTRSLSPSALADLRARVAGRPEWDGKVVFDK